MSWISTPDLWLISGIAFTMFLIFVGLTIYLLRSPKPAPSVWEEDSATPETIVPTMLMEEPPFERTQPLPRRRANDPAPALAAVLERTQPLAELDPASLHGLALSMPPDLRHIFTKKGQDRDQRKT